MELWLTELLTRLSSNPALQGLLAALATFVLEDPTTIGCGLLVAERKMAFLTAYVGVATGIAVGDIGLYGLGRLAGPRVASWGLVGRERLERGSSWFQRNVVAAVVLSRFVPGMRLPTYVAAGILRAPLWRFVVVAVAASLVWTLLLLVFTVQVGESILPMLGRFRWPAAIAALVGFVILQRLAARRLEREVPEDRVTSVFEFWPPWVFYFPVFVYWLWLAIRYRGLLLPTAANPSIYSGGFIGESKEQILRLLSPDDQSSVAAFVAVDAPADPADVDRAVTKAMAAMREAQLDFPVVAKPDVGQRGAGVRPVRDESELRRYLERFPRRRRVILQELVGFADDPGAGGPDSNLSAAREAGVLYWRHPEADQGTLFSVTLKIFPTLSGDGRRTLRELVADDPRAQRLKHIYLRRLSRQADMVIPEGERVPLVFAGNHSQGTIFRDGTHLKTPQLEQRVDQIAKRIPGFHFGRFDVRFDDLGDFLVGRDFKIIEINGASAEATHIWDASIRLTEAYSVLFTQFRTLFEIGAANRHRGHRPIGLAQFLKDVLAYRRLARDYPSTR